MKHYVNKAVEIDGLVYLEDVGISLEVNTEIEWLEPYSWGQSRGKEVIISDIRLIGVQVGGLVLSSEQADKMFGEDAIQRVIDNITLEDIEQ